MIVVFEISEVSNSRIMLEPYSRLLSMSDVRLRLEYRRAKGDIEAPLGALGQLWKRVWVRSRMISFIDPKVPPVVIASYRHRLETYLT